MKMRSIILSALISFQVRACFFFRFFLVSRLETTSVSSGFALCPGLRTKGEKNGTMAVTSHVQYLTKYIRTEQRKMAYTHRKCGLLHRKKASRPCNPRQSLVFWGFFQLVSIMRTGMPLPFSVIGNGRGIQVRWKFENHERDTHEELMCIYALLQNYCHVCYCPRSSSRRSQTHAWIRKCFNTTCLLSCVCCLTFVSRLPLDICRTAPLTLQTPSDMCDFSRWTLFLTLLVTVTLPLLSFSSYPCFYVVLLDTHLLLLFCHLLSLTLSHPALSFLLLLLCCVHIGTDSLPKTGLQPRHLTIGVQGKYEARSWWRECKYCLVPRTGVFMIWPSKKKDIK